MHPHATSTPIMVTICDETFCIRKQGLAGTAGRTRPRFRTGASATRAARLPPRPRRVGRSPAHRQTIPIAASADTAHKTDRARKRLSPTTPPSRSQRPRPGSAADGTACPGWHPAAAGAPASNLETHNARGLTAQVGVSGSVSRRSTGPGAARPATARRFRARPPRPAWTAQGPRACSNPG